MWSISRGGLPPVQNFTLNDTVWFIFTNENTTITHSGNCTTSDGIAGPYTSSTPVRNLFYPFENYTLGASDRPFFFDGKAPFFGCLESITLQPYDFKALVPAESWVAPIPALSKFTPGHDARIEVADDNQNPNSVNVQIEFSDLMDCDSVSKSITFNLTSSGKGSTPSVKSGSVECLTIPDANIKPAVILGATVSRWHWKATIENFADGILTITIKNPQSQGGVGTGVSRLLTALCPASILTNHPVCATRLPIISCSERANRTT